MEVVIVKHENCGQKYLFALPEKKSLYAGQLVRVRTKKGESLATCLCDSFRLEEGSEVYKSILASFGASEPLAPVIGSYWFDNWEKEKAAIAVENN